MLTKLNHLITLDAELDRLSAAIASGVDVAGNTARIAAIKAEAAAIMGENRELIAPAGLPASVPTSGQFETLDGTQDVSAFASERHLLRAAIYNSASAGVMYFSAAAQLWKVDATRGREICVILGINPDERKPVRRF